MKKRVLTLLMIALMCLVTLASCKQPGSNADGPNKDDPTGNTQEKENLIYNTTSELYFIAADGLDSNISNLIYSDLMSQRIEPILMAAPSSEAHAHEIVVGNTDRAISKAAISRMNRIDKNTDDERIYLIYSDGSSVAIVWEEDEDGVARDTAVEYFRENCINSELAAPQGTVFGETVDLLEHYTALDSAASQPLWEELSENYGKEIADAMRRYYSILSPDSVIWLANLYDSDICVCRDLYGEEECSGTKYCGTGGFYYSNSGRDTLGYLPDAESTAQALSFLVSTGLATSRGGNWKGVVTEEMQQKIGDFIYALEEPNGYFYHPQWGIEFTDSKLSRRARDLTWCCNILSVLGRTPKYTTASGVLGENAKATASPLTERLGQSCVYAVSKAVLTAGDSYAAHLQDLSAFKAYLDSKDIHNSSYSVGNELTSQTAQIQARDRQIGTESDPTPLMDYLIEWLNASQNPATGTWDWKDPTDVGYSAYYGVNGLMKISGIYNAHKAVIPHAEEAVNSAAADAMSEEDAVNIVNVYNPWVAISNVFTNLRKYAVNGEARADSLLSQLLEYAPEAIDMTRVKVQHFLKEDGSGCYTWKYSPAQSQGCPVAVPNSEEGDVNGGSIAINGTLGNMCNALGITKIPQFGERERYLFRKEISNLSPVEKDNDSSIPDIIDFEYDEIGEESTYISTQHNGGSGTSLVVADPTGSGKGNVTEIISYAGAGDNTIISCQNTAGTSTTFVFESDIYLDSASRTYAVQVNIGGAYMFTLRENSEGKIELWESSSTSASVSVDEYLGVTVDKQSWFRVKVEYYYGDHDNVRIKFYADTDLTDSEGVKLYAVTDNYFDNAGKKLNSIGQPSKSFTNSRFYVVSDADAKMYIDNVNVYCARLGYTEVIDPNDQPCLNIDAPDKSRVTYGFDGGEIPADISVSGTSFEVDENGRLAVSLGSSSITVPMTVREKGADCRYISFKLCCDSATVSDTLLTIIGTDYNKDVFKIKLVAREDNNGKYITLVPSAAADGKDLDNVRIPFGEEHEISLAYYHTEGVIIVYLDGVFSGAVTTFVDGYRKLMMDSLKISVTAAKRFALTLDDIVVEKNTSNFNDAVAPDKEEKIYDFSSEDAEVETVGAGTSVSGGALNMNVISNAKQSVSVPVNNRANIFNAVRLMLDIKYNKTASSGTTHVLRLTDNKGNTVAAFELVANGSAVDLYEVNKQGRAKNPIYTYSAAGIITLNFEIFTSEKVIYLYDGIALKAKSSIFSGDEFIENGFGRFTVESGAAKTNVSIDNIKAESLYTVYNNLSVLGAYNPENDLSSGIDFESSSTGSMPSAFSPVLNGTNSVSIQNVMNGVTGEYSNVYVHNKTSDGNDYINIVSKDNLSDSSCIAFEADLRFDFTSVSTVMRLYFGSPDVKNCAYYINVINSDGKIRFKDVSNADGAVVIGNDFATGVDNGEWFKLRVEYYMGTRDSVRIKLFVNGSCIGISDNFAGSHQSSASPMASFNCVRFFYMSAGKGTMYMDNVSFTGSSATCTENVTTK